MSALLYFDTQGVRVHNAQMLGQFVDKCVIFIPTREGRSHCPESSREGVHIQMAPRLVRLRLALVD